MWGSWTPIASISKKVIVSSTFYLFATPECSTNPCQPLVSMFTSPARVYLSSCSRAPWGSSGDNILDLGGDQHGGPLHQRKEVQPSLPNGLLNLILQLEASLRVMPMVAMVETILSRVTMIGLSPHPSRLR